MSITITTMSFRLGIVIPALNEEATIGSVVEESISKTNGYCDPRIIVCDNGSVDRTAEVARMVGAEVVFAARRGYGSACLEAIRHLGDWPDYLLFMDADGSSCPEEIPRLMEPLLSGQADLVMGMRPDNSPMTHPQRWGTKLAVWLVNIRWRTRFRDMGPFRAIRMDAYRSLGMKDQTWGWTIEMQILSAIRGLRYEEIPVKWEERRGGRSKISGTFSGVVRAGTRILWIVLRYSFGE